MVANLKFLGVGIKAETFDERNDALVPALEICRRVSRKP